MSFKSVFDSVSDMVEQLLNDKAPNCIKCDSKDVKYVASKSDGNVYTCQNCGNTFCHTS
jgi:ribosomal protein L37AE/L43A